MSHISITFFHNSMIIVTCCTSVVCNFTFSGCFAFGWIVLAGVSLAVIRSAWMEADLKPHVSSSPKVTAPYVLKPASKQCHSLSDGAVRSRDCQAAQTAVTSRRFRAFSIEASTPATQVIHLNRQELSFQGNALAEVAISSLARTCLLNRGIWSALAFPLGIWLCGGSAVVWLALRLLWALLMARMVISAQLQQQQQQQHDSINTKPFLKKCAHHHGGAAKEIGIAGGGPSFSYSPSSSITISKCILEVISNAAYLCRAYFQLAVVAAFLPCFSGWLSFHTISVWGPFQLLLPILLVMLGIFHYQQIFSGRKVKI